MTAAAQTIEAPPNGPHLQLVTHHHNAGVHELPGLMRRAARQLDHTARGDHAHWAGRLAVTPDVAGELVAWLLGAAEREETYQATAAGAVDSGPLIGDEAHAAAALARAVLDAEHPDQLELWFPDR